MNYENDLPNKIITRVMEDTGCEIIVSKLAHQMKKPVPSVWNKVAHKRRWDAQTWLQTLWALGYARYVQSDISDGHITIRVPLNKYEIKKLDNLKSEDLYLKPDEGVEEDS